MTNYTVLNSTFTSQGERCDGELFLPKGGEQAPVIIMAHGFGAEKAFRLPAFAERFVAAGYAVYLFDYRGFGKSEGQPRQLIDPSRHLQDWQAAIRHVRSLSEVDGQRIALWGSSFSGGHVLVTAAHDPHIKAVIAQVPYVDSLSTIKKLGLKYLLQAVPHAGRDLFNMILGRRPYLIKVYGKATEFAALKTDESYDGYRSIVPEDSPWKNECPARILVTFALYRPIRTAPLIYAPVLLQIGEHDSLFPTATLQQMGERMPNCEQITYPIGHFDIYHGEPFERAVADQLDFLRRQL